MIHTAHGTHAAIKDEWVVRFKIFNHTNIVVKVIIFRALLRGDRDAKVLCAIALLAETLEY